MPQYLTNEERMQHSQAKKIPQSVWEQIFDSSISADVLRLMAYSRDELMIWLQSASVRSLSTDLHQVYVAIALSHPDLEFDVLKNIADHFYLAEQDVFILLVIIGKKQWLEEFERFYYDFFQEMMQSVGVDEYLAEAYATAAGLGRVRILKYLESKVPDRIKELIAFDDFRAYTTAASYGHIRALKHFESKVPDCIQQALDADDFDAYIDAAAHGEIGVLIYLESRVPDLMQQMMEAGRFDAYYRAAGNGKIEVLEHLESRAPDHIQQMIADSDCHSISYPEVQRPILIGNLPCTLIYTSHKPKRAPDEYRLYAAYRVAAASGNLEVLNHLESKAPEKIQEMIAAYDFAAYRMAAENGHLDVLNHLESKAPEKIQKMIAADNFAVYRMVAASGNLEVLNHLESKAPKKIQEMIAAEDFAAYREAALRGHIEILVHLESKAPKKIQKMIEAQNFSAYSFAASTGHLKVVKYLETKVLDKMKMIAADNFRAYQSAVRTGMLKILKSLELTIADKVQEMFQAIGGECYIAAARNDEMLVLKHLESKIPGVISSSSVQAYAAAAEAGNLEVLIHLESKAPDKILEMIEGAYVVAADRHIIKRMLPQSSRCVAHVETHIHEYGSYVLSFLNKTIHTLRQTSLSILAPDVFDISDSEQAKICFYLLRHLIRRNDRSRDDDLRFLLSIPSVKALAHQAVNDGEPNELVRLALTQNNVEAIAILLTLPEVRSLAEQNNYYQNEQRGQLDIAQLVRDRESSMTALTQGEQKRLQNAIQHYQPMLQQAGVAHLMDELRALLVARYEANPARIDDKNGRSITLPMDFAALKKLKLDKTDYQRALNAYYQNKDHTAWRYLKKPNPWMHPNAAYVYSNRSKTEQWSTFEEYQPFIAMLWLAAKDEHYPAIDGHTQEGRLDQFIDELAHIGRAHNWDSSRINADGKSEEYDDLTGDRPSCFSGVKRRLFQAVVGHPLLCLLTQDILLLEIREFVQKHFDRKLDARNREILKEAFNDFYDNTIDMSDASKACFASLNLSSQDIQELELYLVGKYGASYLEDKELRSFVVAKLTLNPQSKAPADHYHALLLDGLVGLSAKKVPNCVNSVRFFAEKPERRAVSPGTLYCTPGT